MNTGSLYQIKKLFWLLFPTKERAASSSLVRHWDDGVDLGDPAYAASYSRKYNCNVSWVPPESFVVCLEEDGKLKKFLTTEGLIGWIRFGEGASCNDYFEEVKSE
jgi:hypothetical protein